MVTAALKARIAALERNRAAGNQSGLALLELIVEAEHKTAADVVAVEVGPQHDRRRILRSPGEGLGQLEERANPARTWHASPAPIFEGDDRETEASEALRLVLTMNEEFRIVA